MLKTLRERSQKRKKLLAQTVNFFSYNIHDWKKIKVIFFNTSDYFCHIFISWESQVLLN